MSLTILFSRLMVHVDLTVGVLRSILVAVVVDQTGAAIEMWPLTEKINLLEGSDQCGGAWHHLVLKTSASKLAIFSVLQIGRQRSIDCWVSCGAETSSWLSGPWYCSRDTDN